MTVNEKFNEWLKKCPVEFKKTSHLSDKLVSYNFDMEKRRDTYKYNTIEASGYYLTTYLPEDFDTWSDEKLYKFCEENVYHLYEGMDGKDLFQEMVRS